VQLEMTNDELRTLGERIFDLVRELAGDTPAFEKSSGWYKATSEHGVFLYLYFLGAKARRNPPNSVRLVAKWDPSFAGKAVEESNDWFGGHPSAGLTARPEHSEEAAAAEAFIRHAFRLRARHSGRR
jgi:hypothetical protein